MWIYIVQYVWVWGLMLLQVGMLLSSYFFSAYISKESNFTQV